MQKSKLISLLKTFSKEEMKDFGKFISSPYFSSGRNLLPFYTIIKKHYPEFNQPSFSEEKIFQRLFKNEKYSDKKSRHKFSVIVSEMYSMTEKFIQAESFFKESVYKDILLLKELEHREALDLFWGVADRIQKLDEETPKDQFYLQKKYLYYKSLDRGSRQVKYARDYNDVLNSAQDSLIIYFYSELSAIIAARKLNYNKDTKLNEISELFDNCFDFEKFTSALLNIKSGRHYINQLLIYSRMLESNYNDLSSYEKLKSMLKANTNNLAVEFSYMISTSLMNCSLFQSKGDTSYFKNDYLDLNDELMKRALDEGKIRFLSRDLLLIKNIYNFVKICVKTNQLERLAEFIKQYSKYFYEPVRKDAAYFAEGYLEFARSNYEKALGLLSKANFSIPMLVKEIKIMKMKSCYELGYYDLLYNEIDTYRHFISSTKEVNEQHLQSDKELMKFFKRLAAVKEKPDPQKLLRLKKDVEIIGYKTFHTAWVLTKVNELEAK